MEESEMWGEINRMYDRNTSGCAFPSINDLSYSTKLIVECRKRWKDFLEISQFSVWNEFLKKYSNKYEARIAYRQYLYAEFLRRELTE